MDATATDAAGPEADQSDWTLIGPEDPPPYQVLNPAAGGSVVLTADHAGNAVPAALDRLGVDDQVLHRHVGWDIGIHDVTSRVATALDAVAVAGCYSRLVVDLNRDPGDPSAMPALSDGTRVPGNENLSLSAREARLAAIFRPYHEQVETVVEARLAAGTVPALVSLHSFTPVFAGHERPWHVGVLWAHDARIAGPLLERFRAQGDLVVGDNEPYSMRDPHGYTVETHAIPRGLPYVLIEIRQDLIDTPRGAAEWSDRVTNALTPILAERALYRVAPQ